MASLRTSFAVPVRAFRVYSMRGLAPLILILAVLVVSGCGTTRDHKRYGVNQVEEWQPDYEAKRVSVVDTSIKTGILYLGDGQFVMKLEQDYRVTKNLYNQPVYSVRTSKDPNLFYILNPFIWLICLDKPAECFGRDGDWYGPYDNGDKEFVRVVDEEIRTGELGYPSASLDVLLTAKGKSGEWEKNLKPEISGGQAKLDVKGILLESPFEPEEFYISAKLNAGEATAAADYYYSSKSVASLNLFSEKWLTKPELYSRYVHQIRSCMNESDYKCAVKQFFKIQDLEIDLPATFYFHFAKALSLVGDNENARRAAQMYLRDPRHQGYLTEAQAFL
ncbi:hypothetical protein FWJ25_03020 [Marinobacter salinexigens]|uniref:Uncharacterized protein n=1 Tax=Marinobacter salinexigens TaxID=2919747 RepID=A0A5B0VPA6_9GAMM|nr:hypothetical protein [Marinobacter salinexigens]KAA1176118.1 hypothetical protein FWJ25_03020 [Marinobacter salinexigens]